MLYNNQYMLYFLKLQYSGEDELMLDFEVMFDNARYYNEEDSQVYQVKYKANNVKPVLGFRVRVRFFSCPQMSGKELPSCEVKLNWNINLL